MKRIRHNSALVGMLILGLGAHLALADDQLNKEAQQAMQVFYKNDSTLKPVVASATAYVIFPSIGKGGFIIGGEHGKGLVYQNGNAIGEATVTEVNIGAQVGGGSYSELIVFNSPDALRDFKASNLEMSAKANATVSSEGAGSTAKYEQGVAVFTMAKSGAMVQAAVGGQKFKFKPTE